MLLYMMIAAIIASLWGIYRALFPTPTPIGQGKTVVIVGAGFAGMTLASYLQDRTSYRIILIEKKKYFEYTPSMLHVLVNPSHMSVTHLPYTQAELLDKNRVTIIHEEVVQITDQAIATKQGSKFNYDKLVLAMGADYADHIKPQNGEETIEARKQQILKVHENIKECKKVTIFGAGLVGTELAAEIAETFPHIQCVLRSREETVLPGFVSTAQQYAAKWLVDRKVEIIYGNTIPPFKYEKGENEMVFNCTGLRSVPLPFAKTDAPATPVDPDYKPVDLPGKTIKWEEHAEERMKVAKVDDTLRLYNQPNIFCMGDMMTEPAKQGKVAYMAELNAWLVCENIIRVEQGMDKPYLWQFPRDLSVLPTPPVLVCCSLGNWDGVLIFNQLIMGGKLAAISKHFIERSKMWFLQGKFFGKFTWTMAEPMTLYMNRAYHAVARVARVFGYSGL